MENIVRGPGGRAACSTIMIVVLSVWFVTYAQCPTTGGIYKKLKVIEDDASLSNTFRLQQALALQKQFISCKLTPDSVYARLLHRIALYEYLGNDQVATASCINSTLESITINRSGKRNCDEAFAINTYYNAGKYYESIRVYDKAILYFDTTIIVGKKYPTHPNFRFVHEARVKKVLSLKDNGDYQKSIDESTMGLKEAHDVDDVASILKFLNQRAECKLYQGQLQSSLTDADSAIVYSKLLADTFELCSAIKVQALVYEELKMFPKAEALFQKAIQLRITTADSSQVANDYLDFGNYYLNKHKNYANANQYYLKMLAYAIGDEGKSKALSVLGMVEFYKNDYQKALALYSKSLQALTHSKEEYAVANPNANVLRPVMDQDLLISILNNKIEALTVFYKHSSNSSYVNAALATAMLADTLITSLRYQQVNEQSKLYWRDHSREIYTYAMEAAYLTHNNDRAFYFMEKSRAVLLNDKLNELGASLHLDEKEIAKEQELKIALVTEQQKLSLTTPGSPEYNKQQLKLLNANDEFEHYIKSLEKTYPAYYQYKYVDQVSSLQTLQQYLKTKQQSFIHYFVNDTVAYILSITPTTAELKKLSKNDFNYSQFSMFLQVCADKQRVNNNYSEFASLSNEVYKILFQPTNVPKGRVVICPDNFIVPFEALCSDPEGKKFLVYDYAFSYVYSARYLLASANTNAAKENFIGFAPVNFRSSLDVPSLLKSGSALNQSASFYKSSTLFKNANASRSNFLNEIGGYSVVNVFSHASADSTGREPLLFMQDSVIMLSELQLLTNPATQLVVLSACQTNVGKNATGEGIYSLARGFTSAGIPSVAATLWQADEETIYRISEKFHEYLAHGMSKDEALQKAKLDFMKTGHEKLLPYYWANMIIMGNAEPIDLRTSSNTWIWFAAGFAIILLMVLAAKRKKLLALFTNRK